MTLILNFNSYQLRGYILNLCYSKVLIIKWSIFHSLNTMDAYHIAYAESKEVDYFITVDKQLINASKKVNLKIKVINPIEFIMEVI